MPSFASPRLLPRRRESLQLFEPVQHHVDVLLGRLRTRWRAHGRDDYELLAVGRDVVIPRERAEEIRFNRKRDSGSEAECWRGPNVNSDEALGEMSVIVKPLPIW